MTPSPCRARLVTLLRALDVPARCGCRRKLVRLCQCAGKRHGPDCDCPYLLGARPCPCIEGIDAAAFPWTFAAWTALLRASAPRRTKSGADYAERRRLDRPRQVRSRQARVAVLAMRFRRQLCLWHPQDAWQSGDETPAAPSVAAPRRVGNGRDVREESLTLSANW